MAQATDTQATRRAKYGLNIVVALTAAVALVVLLNAAADWAFRTAEPSVKGWMRLDVTATRQYSLSPQTRQVLAGIDEPYTIVALFRGTGVQSQQILDLIEEYPRYSAQITAETLNPDRDITRVEQILRQVIARYDEPLAPLDAALREGLQALEQVRDQVTPVTQMLRATIEQSPSDSVVAKVVQELYSPLKQIEDELTRLPEAVRKDLDAPLPDYAFQRNRAVSVLNELARLTPAAMTRLRLIVSSPQVADDLKNEALAATNRLQQAQRLIEPAIMQLEPLQSPTAYAEARAALLAGESVAVLGPDDVRVILLEQMYRALPAEAQESARQPQVGFLGEEKITGALVSLSLDAQPRAVFVYSGPQPAVGPRGSHQYVAQRLESASFEVLQWTPEGQRTPFGNTSPASAPPAPEHGRPTVWIVLPPPAANPSTSTAITGADARQQVANLIEQRLADGDAAMVLLGANPAAVFGSPDPVLDLVQTWGLKPRLDRLVLRELTQADRSRVATTQFLVNRWPDALPVTQAMGSVPAAFIGPSPVETEPGEGVRVWPLVVLQEPRMWLTDRFDSPQQILSAPYDEQTARDSFTIGVAAERDPARLIVVADAVWTHDQLTTYGNAGLPAELSGLAFPGNSELFLASAQWLAGLESLIAASPRTQDIRRIEQLSPAALTTYRWILLAGIPLMIVAAGAAVHVVRRRG